MTGKPLADLQALTGKARKHFYSGNYAQCIKAARAVCSDFPEFIDAWLILADALAETNRYAEALSGYGRALELEPHAPDILHNIGTMLVKLRQFEKAVTFLHQAESMGLKHPALHRNLGHAHMMQGDHLPALEEYKKALALDKDHRGANSGMLFCLSHTPGISPMDLLAAHQQYGAALESSFKAQWVKTPAIPGLKRRLRLGFVSADMQDHPVARFLIPVLKYMDRKHFAMIMYHNSPIEDQTTRSIKSQVDAWRRVDILSDQNLASQIRADGIDVLFDLSGHTAGNRLGVFARKPCPVQLSWIGYPGTTGLTAVDWRVMDRYIAPPGALEDQFVEKLLYIPWASAFDDIKDAPQPGPLPAIENGYITFGSFNRPNKISLQVLDLWAKVLQVLPGACLIIGNMGDESLRRRMLKQFELNAVESGRIRFEPPRPIMEYLALHQKVDVLLDTFPFGSGTTVNFALWMGVPLITLEGPILVQKLSASHLRRAGLGEWVTQTPDDYLALAQGLVHKLPELAELRRGLRSRLSLHPARGGKAVAEGLGEALIKIWKERFLSPGLKEGV